MADEGSSAWSRNHTRPSDWIPCRPSGATPASFQRAVFHSVTPAVCRNPNSSTKGYTFRCIPGPGFEVYFRVKGMGVGSPGIITLPVTINIRHRLPGITRGPRKYEKTKRQRHQILDGAFPAHPCSAGTSAFPVLAGSQLGGGAWNRRSFCTASFQRTVLATLRRSRVWCARCDSKRRSKCSAR